ncbi:hypothetical protein GCM10023231_31190 [Olivibacter ginsenosidimutans]|uniref:Fatty acid hydroxylase domain-containing protein n=2 Tax=Olivibacter ginsenosidimutans TaxID=1176537 RepID=A0ABP9BX36_9SPHI
MLAHCSNAQLVLLFFVQNLILFILALAFGTYLRRKYHQPREKIAVKDWLVASGTVLINAVITDVGFLLWKSHWISIDFSLSWLTVVHVIILFLAMDLLMYIFHYLLHHSALHQYIHAMHHEAVEPLPIDLFVLHPLETIAFGGLWLALLLTATFNVWAIILYLLLNVVFGIVGHLGFEPLRENTAKFHIDRFIGTSSFHHKHHQDMKVNFGFYTNIWDRIFGTYRDK